MKSFSLNTFAASVFCCALFFLLLGKVTDGIFGEKMTLHELPQSLGESGIKQEKTPDIPIALALRQVTREMGERIAKKCLSCHTFLEGEKSGIGPNLWSTFNKNIASKSGFGYSKALRGLTGQWDYETLDNFLKKPARYVKGTKMAFAGLKKVEDRAAMILFLRSLGGDKTPLPQVPQEDTSQASPEEKPVTDSPPPTKDKKEDTSQASPEEKPVTDSPPPTKDKK